jgi:hypothetical protein
MSVCVQAPYVPPVAAYNQEEEEDWQGDQGGYDAAYNVRQMHAAARSKAYEAGQYAGVPGAPDERAEYPDGEPVSELSSGDRMGDIRAVAQDRQV